MTGGRSGGALFPLPQYNHIYPTVYVFARSNIGMVGSNPTQGMDVCVYSVFVLSSGLAKG
jgi:hypothetical protein